MITALQKAGALAVGAIRNPKLCQWIPFFDLLRLLDDWLSNRLFGSDWRHEPGSVWLGDVVFLKGLPPIKSYTLFEYTHWRERSLWRGRAYANVQDQGHNVAIRSAI